MASKRASLLGRGAEILGGSRRSESVDPSASGNAGSWVRGVTTPHLAPITSRPRTSPIEGEPLSPECADSLVENALAPLSADRSRTDRVSPEPSEHGPPDFDLQSLPSLATVPAQPSTSVGEKTVSVPSKEVSLPDRSADGDQGAQSQGGTALLQGAAEATDADALVACAGRLVWSAGNGCEGDRYAQPEAGPETPPSPFYRERSGSVSEDGEGVPPPRDRPQATDPSFTARLDPLPQPQPRQQASTLADRSSGTSACADQEQRRTLWNLILELYPDVSEILTGDEGQPRALLLLKEAQHGLLQEPCRFDLARYKVGLVESMLAWRRNVTRWSRTYGWGLFAYEIMWMVVLGSGVLWVSAGTHVPLGWVGEALDAEMSLHVWNTMMAGGLGAAVGALDRLYRQVAKTRDFDRRHIMWYVAEPMIGLLVGALVALMTAPAFGPGLAGTREDAQASLSVISYALACMLGYGQRLVLGVTNRLSSAGTALPGHRLPAAELPADAGLPDAAS